MKKVLVFLVVGFILLGSCTAQNVNAQSANNAQRIVGTWDAIITVGTTTGAGTWVFSADGTLVVTDADGTRNHKYAVTDTKLVFAELDNNGTIPLGYTGTRTALFADYSMSSDGKTLVFTLHNIQNNIVNFWLTKR